MKKHEMTPEKWYKFKIRLIKDAMWFIVGATIGYIISLILKL